MLGLATTGQTSRISQPEQTLSQMRMNSVYQLLMALPKFIPSLPTTAIYFWVI